MQIIRGLLLSFDVINHDANMFWLGYQTCCDSSQAYRLYERLHALKKHACLKVMCQLSAVVGVYVKEEQESALPEHLVRDRNSFHFRIQIFYSLSLVNIDHTRTQPTVQAWSGT